MGLRAAAGLSLALASCGGANVGTDFDESLGPEPTPEIRLSDVSTAVDQLRSHPMTVTCESTLIPDGECTALDLGFSGMDDRECVYFVVRSAIAGAAPIFGTECLEGDQLRTATVPDYTRPNDAGSMGCEVSGGGSAFTAAESCTSDIADAISAISAASVD